MTETPLHVRVAEALGWSQGTAAVRYDKDWAATGPLIEKCGVCVGPRGDGGWEAEALDEVSSFGPTPLIAVCHLILKLAEEGKLHAHPDPVRP